MDLQNIGMRVWLLARGRAREGSARGRAEGRVRAILPASLLQLRRRETLIDRALPLDMNEGEGQLGVAMSIARARRLTQVDSRTQCRVPPASLQAQLLLILSGRVFAYHRIVSTKDERANESHRSW